MVVVRSALEIDEVKPTILALTLSEEEYPKDEDAPAEEAVLIGGVTVLPTTLTVVVTL